MGKAANRRLRNRMSLIDKFEAASSTQVNEMHRIHEDEEEIIVPTCPYLTSIITVVVGSTLEEFKVHEGVISASKVLASKCQGFYQNDYLSLPDVNPSVFELALCYMYGKDYKDYYSSRNPMPKKSEARAAAFKRHSLLYCFARKYELEELITLAKKNIKDLDEVDYQGVVLAAKEAYKHLPDDESWFRECFKVETKRALRDSHDLFWEPWMLDTVRDGGGNFSVDLFTTMMERYQKVISRHVAVGRGSQSSPKLPRWFSPNLSHGVRAPSTNSYSTCSTEDTDSEADSATDVTSGDEIIRVEESSCVGDYTPGRESPYLVEAYPEPEVESASPTEDATAADNSYIAEAALEEAPSREPENLQEEASSSVPEDSFEANVVATALPEVESRSYESQPEYDDDFHLWGTWASRKSKKTKNRRTRNLFELDDVRAEPATEPVYLVYPAPAEELLGSADEPAAEEPATEEPVAEEPAAEETAREEPAAEPSAEEPAAEEKASEEIAREEPTAEEPSAEEPSAEEPSAEEPAAEEYASEEPAAEENASEEPAAEENASEEPATEEYASEEPAAEEKVSEEPAAEEKAAEETASEEPPAEERTADEPVSGYPFDDIADDLPAEPLTYDAPLNQPSKARRGWQLGLVCEPEPAGEPEVESQPIFATEDPPADLLPEPLWGFSTRKSTTRRKKARVAFPSTAQDLPKEPDLHATANFTTKRDIAPPADDALCEDETLPADDASPSGRRCTSLPMSRYAPLVQPQGSSAQCTKRGFHLARESHWIQCLKCRAEMSEVARKMARECNPGWDVFS